MSTKVVSKVTFYDFSALLASLAVILLDQFTKSLVVTYLSPPRSKSVSILGQYLVVFYIKNYAAAFSLLRNTSVLVVSIIVALAVIAYIYYRFSSIGPWYYKVTLGFIIGGALGNIIDRIHNGGYVVDFISFRIPQIKLYFAVFNIADACISLGVLALFVLIIFTKQIRKTDDTGTH